MRNAGFPDTTPSSLPPIEQVSGGFKEGENPAATFNRGAQSIAEIQTSADAVREHGRDIASRPNGMAK
jgi:hypothetical protein